MLEEEIAYATDEVGRLTKVLDEQNCLLQASREQAAQKDVAIKDLEQKVKVYFKTLLQSKQSATKMVKKLNNENKKHILYQVKEQQEAVEKMVRNGGFKAAEPTVTPKSLNRVIPLYIFLLFKNDTDV